MRKNQRRKMIELGETNEFSQMSHHLVVEHRFVTKNILYTKPKEKKHSCKIRNVTMHLVFLLLNIFISYLTLYYVASPLAKKCKLKMLELHRYI